MNFFSQATEYICELKDKGYYDHDFMIEYEFLIYETYKHNHPEAIQEVNIVQTNSLLQRQKLR